MQSSNITSNVILQFAVAAYEKFTGSAYSPEDIKRLSELKRVYEESFTGALSPVEWDLDEKHCPTHRMKNQNWALYIIQQTKKNQDSGSFHYQSNRIAEYASDYLAQRMRRKIGSGKPGDLVEQFFGEWIHFAINNLLTYGANEGSIKKIKERIEYLDKVIKNPNIFKFGAVERRKNKIDTIEKIKEELESCLVIISQETLKKCARSDFEVCRKTTAGMLLACVDTIYYLRATPVHDEPLGLRNFLDMRQRYHSTKASKEIYPQIKNTHTGIMLYEVISRSGLDAFGVESEEESALPLSFTYFGKNFQPLPYDLKPFDIDLPPWVNAEEQQEQLQALQLLGESILRVALLKRLLEDAYELSGHAGNLWAYGDKQGKQSLEALLFLLEAELDILYKRFYSIYAYHNKARRLYNLNNRINADQGVNPNFVKVDQQELAINRFYHSLKAVITSIREQMAKYPEDAVRRVNEKKQAFYYSLIKYIEKFYPEKKGEFKLLQEDLPRAAVPLHISSAAQVDEIVLHKLPIREDKQHLVPWRLGNNYDHWVKGFFTRNSYLLEQNRYLVLQLEDKLNSISPLDEIKQAAQSYLANIHVIRSKINNERPRWRFKLAWWPIKTKGWPFNRQADQFSKSLLFKLDVIEIDIQPAILRAQLRIKREEDEKKSMNGAAPFQSENFPKRKSISSEELCQKFSHWYATFEEKYDTWHNNPEGNSFVLFEDSDNAHAFLTNLLMDVDSGPQEYNEFLKNACGDIAHLLTSTMPICAEQNSKSQALLLVQILQVVTSTAGSPEREQNLMQFKRDCMQLFSRHLPRPSVCGQFSTCGQKTTVESKSELCESQIKLTN